MISTPGTITGRRRKYYDDDAAVGGGVEIDDSIEYMDITPNRPIKRKRRPLERLHTEVLLRMVLQDAQTRLVFRAQAMLVQEVEYYVVKDGDLDYPEKLESGE